MHLIAAFAQRLVTGSGAQRPARDGQHLGCVSRPLWHWGGLDVFFACGGDRLLAQVRPVDLSLRLQLRQHIALAPLGGFRIAPRRKSRRRLRNSGQHRGFRQGELARVLGEIVPRRFLDAVAPTAKVHMVEIEVQDLVLGELVLQAPRQDELPHLSCQGAFGGQEHQLDHLLGDGAAALRGSTGDDVSADRPQDTAVVEALVLVEVRILGSEDGENHVPGDLRHWNHGPTLGEYLADDLLMTVIDPRGLRGLVVPQGADGWKVAAEVRVRAQHEQRAYHQRRTDQFRQHRAAARLPLLALGRLALGRLALGRLALCLLRLLACHLVRRRL